MKLLEGKIRRIIRSKYFHGRCASENVKKKLKSLNHLFILSQILYDTSIVKDLPEASEFKP